MCNQNNKLSKTVGEKCIWKRRQVGVNVLFAVNVNFLVIMFSALEQLSSPAVSSYIKEGAVICARFYTTCSPISSLGVAQLISHTILQSVQVCRYAGNSQKQSQVLSPRILSYCFKNPSIRLKTELRYRMDFLQGSSLGGFFYVQRVSCVNKQL